MSAGNITQFLAQLATFTVTSANATAGAVYTSGGKTFTVLNTISAKTTLLCTASGTPAASGTLTKVTGTGDATITFSAVTISSVYSDPLNTSGVGGQSDYSEYAKIGIVGMPYDTSLAVDDISPVAYETIGLGLGIVRMPSYSSPGQFVARLPRANVATLVFSADLIASNVVNMSVNGVAMAAVTYATSHAATMAAIVTALEAISGVSTSTVLDPADTNSRTIKVYSNDGLDCLVTGAAVTLGSTQATITVSVTTTDVILGASMHTQGKEQQLGSLILNYAAGDVVNCRRMGRLWVFAETAVSAGDSVYIRLQDEAGKVRGAFGNTSDSGKCVLVSGWTWFQGTTDSANGLAVLQTK